MTYALNTNPKTAGQSRESGGIGMHRGDVGYKTIQCAASDVDMIILSSDCEVRWQTWSPSYKQRQKTYHVLIC